jgi:hypothetical protein
MSTPLPEIRSLIRRHAGAGKIASAQTGIPGLRVTAARVMTEPVNQVYEPMFGLVAQGTKSILLADKAFHYGAGQYLVVSVDLPVTSRIIAASEGDPYLSIGLILRAGSDRVASFGNWYRRSVNGGRCSLYRVQTSARTAARTTSP